ncbi:MAG: hypothetical protein ACQEWG_16770 [Bacteroidota bacterium]
MTKNYDRNPISVNGESIMTALELFGEALVESKDEEKNEIAIKLARAVKKLSFQISEKEKRVDELIKINAELAFQIKENAIIEIGSYTCKREQVFYGKDDGAGFDPRYYNKLFGLQYLLKRQASGYLTY